MLLWQNAGYPQKRGNRSVDVARLFALLCLILAGAGMAVAADGWSRYDNARYGYSLPVPPDFPAIAEAGNGDGGVTEAGSTKLMAWGVDLLDESFVAEARSRIESAESEGWNIGYQSVKQSGISWSGRRQGRIVYARGLPGCNDTTAYFQIEYDAAAKRKFDAIVKRLVREFSVATDCL